MGRSAAFSLAALCFLAASLPSAVSGLFAKIPAGTFLMGHDKSVRLPDGVTGGQGNRLYGDASERPLEMLRRPRATWISRRRTAVLF